VRDYGFFFLVLSKAQTQTAIMTPPRPPPKKGGICFLRSIFTTIIYRDSIWISVIFTNVLKTTTLHIPWPDSISRPTCSQAELITLNHTAT
jgi:hypothetical protein